MSLDFVVCKKCGHPMIEDWGECPYCSVSKNLRDKVSFKKGALFLFLSLVSLIVMIICAIPTIDIYQEIEKKEKKKVIAENELKLLEIERDKEERFKKILEDASKKQINKSSEILSTEAIQDVLPSVVLVENQEESSPLEIDRVALGEEMRANPDDIQLGVCYLYLQENPNAINDNLYQTAREILEEEIAKKIRKVESIREQNWNDYVAIKKGVNLFERPMPKNSFVIQQKTLSNRVSPLEIKTREYASYVVKLVDINSKDTEILFFVSGPSTYQVSVPNGTYKLRYMTGKQWYGNKILFGDSCTCVEADLSLSFFDGSGHSVTFYKVEGGNLHTKEIDMEEF